MYINMRSCLRDVTSDMNCCIVDGYFRSFFSAVTYHSRDVNYINSVCVQVILPVMYVSKRVVGLGIHSLHSNGMICIL